MRRRFSALGLAVSLVLAGIGRAEDVFQSGAPGGNGVDAPDSHSDGTNGGNGGDATANSSGPDFSNYASAFGGAGGKGGNGGLGDPAGRAGNGGNGGNATVNISSSSSASEIYLTAYSTAGGGGAPGASAGTLSSAGHGGVGGNAISTMSGLSTSNQAFYIQNNAIGGSGGSAGPLNYYGNGGAGGTGQASVNISTAADHIDGFNSSAVSGNVSAIGGAGGSGYGAGFSGGAGGAGILAPSSGSTTGSGYVAIWASQIGGAGGAGLNFANGGDGADSNLGSSLSGSAPTNQLALSQTASGGAGGASEGGIAGRGGNATNSLSHTYSGTGDVQLVIESYGGTGGRGTGANSGAGGAASSFAHVTGNGYLAAQANAYGGSGSEEAELDPTPTVGAAGGTATVTNPFASNATSAGVGISGFAQGGAGGASSGAGNKGHNGASGTVTNVRVESSFGGWASATANQQGGAGGNGGFGAEGGDGAESHLVNQVSGFTTGILTLSQEATGGNGGRSTFRGGQGGNASSSLTYTDLDGDIVGYSHATGGNGGAGDQGGIAANGANATAAINLSGAHDVTAYGRVTGGIGGDGVHAGNGGVGTLGVVYASSTGGNVSAGVENFGGSGGTSDFGGDSGSGQSVSLNNAVDADALPDFNLAILQLATGGNSGNGFNVGTPGSASSIISKTKSVHELRVVAEATSGVFGNMTDASGDYSAAGTAANGGPAIASSTATNNIGAATAEARAHGNPLYYNYVFTSGGNGSPATATAEAHSNGDGHDVNSIAEATGGVSANTLSSMGASGIATANANSTASGDSRVQASASANGGSGYSQPFFNTNGAPGGDAHSTASAASNGSVEALILNSTAVGGQGGSAFGAGRNAGIGGLAIATASGSANGAPSSATITQSGGFGGEGFNNANAGAGRDSILNNAATFSGAAAIDIHQSAIGGGGGNAEGTGNAGAGGFASSAFSLTHSQSFTASSSATGGAGGLKNGTGSAADGANAIAALNLSSDSDMYAEISATGGNGGSASGSANAGNGGTASLGTVSASSTGATVTIVGTITGGSGGNASGAGHGGNGGSSIITDAIDGSAAPDFNLYLSQSAVGGYGGSSDVGAAGNSGNASSSLSRTKAINSLEIHANATTVTGGGRYNRSGFAGSAGNATAFSSSTNTLGDAISVANAYGGTGGRGTYAVSGNGGNASATAQSNISTAERRSDAEATAIGGAGDLNQLTMAGRGGDALANASANSTAGSVNQEVVIAHANATGGAGGFSYSDSESVFGSHGADGGNATANATVNAPASTGIEAVALADGGIGGGSSGISARSGNASSSATATGALGIEAYAASNSAHNYFELGGSAVAHAKASGASGLSTSNATTSAQYQMILSTSAIAPGENVSETEARVNSKEALADTSLANGLNAASLATARPRAADYLAAVASSPAVADAFGGVSGVFGHAFFSTKSEAVLTTSTSNFASIKAIFNGYQLASTPDLHVGFLNPTVIGSGFDQLLFQVTNGSDAVIFEQNFTSVADAQSYFTNHAINLHDPTPPTSPADDLVFNFRFHVTTSSASSGFAANFVFGVYASKWENISTDWGNPANWSGNSVPDSSAAHADLIESTASPAHVLLNGDRTISHLTLDNGPYIIDAGTPGSTLKLGQFTNNGYIDVLGGQHAINATVLLSGFGGTPVEMTVASGATLTLANLSNIHYTPIHKLGAGRLIINGMQHPTFTYPLIPFAVDGGQVDLNANAGTPATASDSAIAYTDLTVSGESKVVLGADQDLDYLEISTTQDGVQSVDLNSPAGSFRSVRIYPRFGGYEPDIRAYLSALIKNAKDNPGDGIYDSGMAGGNNQIGVGLATDAHGDQYILMRPTRIGDLNLDGSVTIADFIELASHFNQSGLWSDGDVNFDGMVTIADFIDLGANFNQNYSGESFPISDHDQQMLSAFAASVPEPASLLWCAGLVALGMRKAKKRAISY
jgi:hypothetical protein